MLGKSDGKWISRPEVFIAALFFHGSRPSIAKSQLGIEDDIHERNGVNVRVRELKECSGEAGKIQLGF